MYLLLSHLKRCRRVRACVGSLSLRPWRARHGALKGAEVHACGAVRTHCSRRCCQPPVRRIEGWHRDDVEWRQLILSHRELSELRVQRALHPIILAHDAHNLELQRIDLSGAPIKGLLDRASDGIHHRANPNGGPRDGLQVLAQRRCNRLPVAADSHKVRRQRLLLAGVRREKRER